MRTTQSYQFYCRECKSNKQGLSPIEVSITINTKRTFLQLPRKEYPQTFKKQISSKRNNDIKEYLEEIRNNLNKAQTELLRNNLPITADNIKDFIRNGGIKLFTIEEMFNDYINNVVIPKVKAKQITILTQKKYQLLASYFMECINPNTQVDHINNAHIRQFHNYLITTKLQKTSTIGGVLQKLKGIFTLYFENGVIIKNPMSEYKIDKGKPKLEYLTDEEVEKIENCNHPSSSINKTKDLFIFQLNSGLSYGDLMEVTKEDIQIHNNTYFIKKKRIKTGIEFTAVLLPKAIDIMEKYNYNLPKLTNQRYNIYLKDIQQMAGVGTTLTTHLARKTYATRLLNKGVAINVVSKCLGHSNTNITQKHYAKTLDETVLNAVSAVI